MTRARGALAALVLAALPALAAAQERAVASGSFTGASDHETVGTVTVLTTADGTVVRLGDDFAFDGAPDPKLAFGSGGVDKSTLFSELEANSGAQTYILPQGFDASGYDELWLWCEQFDVPLGRAALR